MSATVIAEVVAVIICAAGQIPATVITGAISVHIFADGKGNIAEVTDMVEVTVVAKGNLIAAIIAEMVVVVIRAVLAGKNQTAMVTEAITVFIGTVGDAGKTDITQMIPVFVGTEGNLLAAFVTLEVRHVFYKTENRHVHKICHVIGLLYDKRNQILRRTFQRNAP